MNRTLLVMAAAALLPLAACGSDQDSAAGEASSACTQAFEVAVEEREAGGFGDLRPALESCETVDDFVQASEAFPSAIEATIDPRDYVTTACAADQSRAGTALCQDAAGDSSN